MTLEISSNTKVNYVQTDDSEVPKKSGWSHTRSLLSVAFVGLFGISGYFIYAQFESSRSSWSTVELDLDTPIDTPSCASGAENHTCGVIICEASKCCSCYATCEEENNCCDDYSETCLTTPTAELTEETPSCAESGGNCGYEVCTSSSCCSCKTDCEDENECCNDYSETCRITPSPTEEMWYTDYDETVEEEVESLEEELEEIEWEVEEIEWEIEEKLEEMWEIEDKLQEIESEIEYLESEPTGEPTEETPSCASAYCGDVVCIWSSCCSCRTDCEDENECCDDYIETCRLDR